MRLVHVHYALTKNKLKTELVSMNNVKGLCHTCFKSNIELVIAGEPIPICKKCKYPNETKIVIDESQVL